MRRQTLSAFFAAFSAWATRLATKGGQCVDFFEANVHPRLQVPLSLSLSLSLCVCVCVCVSECVCVSVCVSVQNIKEFLVGPDSLENDPPMVDSPMPDAGEDGVLTPADLVSHHAGDPQAAALVDASVEIGDWQPSGSAQDLVSHHAGNPSLAAVEEERSEAEPPAEPEPAAEPQMAPAPTELDRETHRETHRETQAPTELDMTVEADTSNIRSI